MRSQQPKFRPTQTQSFARLRPPSCSTAQHVNALLSLHYARCAPAPDARKTPSAPSCPQPLHMICPLSASNPCAPAVQRHVPYVTPPNPAGGIYPHLAVLVVQPIGGPAPAPHTRPTTVWAAALHTHQQAVHSKSQPFQLQLSTLPPDRAPNPPAHHSTAAMQRPVQCPPSIDAGRCEPHHRPCCSLLLSPPPHTHPHTFLTQRWHLLGAQRTQAPTRPFTPAAATQHAACDLHLRCLHPHLLPPTPPTAYPHPPLPNIHTATRNALPWHAGCPHRCQGEPRHLCHLTTKP